MSLSIIMKINYISIFWYVKKFIYQKYYIQFEIKLTSKFLVSISILIQFFKFTILVYFLNLPF